MGAAVLELRSLASWVWRAANRVVTVIRVGRDLATIPPLRSPRKKRAGCFGRDDRFCFVGLVVAKTRW